MKTLIVVSGGDAPGINAALFHYTSRATARGDTVVGALGGLPALLDNHIIPLSVPLLTPWMGHAGTYIQTSRDPVLTQTDAETRIKSVLREHQIDNVLLFGGNGSLRHILPLFERWGIPCVAIPTTIDNDVPGTELTLGFDSACNFAYHAIDGILATAHALTGRMFMVETLGGSAGFLALAVAAGSGAHAVLLPEYAYDEKWLTQRLSDAVSRDGFALLLLCEGTHGARTLAETLPQRTGIRMRDIRLGHAQRGATPSHVDRVLALNMALTAYDTLKSGMVAAIIVVRGGQVSLHHGLLPNIAHQPDRSLYNRINGFLD